MIRKHYLKLKKVQIKKGAQVYLFFNPLAQLIAEQLGIEEVNIKYFKQLSFIKHTH